MAKLPKKAKKPLHWIISEKLRTEIETGVYSPGELLPSEFDLGELFGVSRTTVRKAIANLINQGLVYTQQPLVCGETFSRADRTCYSVSLSVSLRDK